ncbi:MAG: hypothetical protein H6737_10425 [Alphaproteobacteria bacterium]|nr:hypothetical protein [Alphaproteobacteria bacterium]
MDLLDRLLADDPDAWAVHTDRLLEAADPRGELALLQRAGPVAHRDLPPDQVQIVEAHGLLGPVKRPDRHRLSWHHGYWRHFGNWSGSQPEDYWRAFFGHPSARFLRELSMRWIDPDLLLELVQQHHPPLVYLHWNERDRVVDMDPFFDALPHLEQLRLWRPARLERGPARPLKGLAVNSGREFPEVTFDLVRYARSGGLAGLEELEAWGSDPMEWVGEVLQHCTPRELAYKGSVPGGIVAGLIASPGFPTLQTLALEGFWPDPEAMEALLTALEGREVPLARYRSTGLEPSPEQLARLKACVGEVSARG